MKYECPLLKLKRQGVVKLFFFSFFMKDLANSRDAFHPGCFFNSDRDELRTNL